jgi:hypothetical protein
MYHILLHNMKTILITQFIGNRHSLSCNSKLHPNITHVFSNQRLYILVFVASPLNTQHQGEKAKTGWLGIRIMCPSCSICLSWTIASVSLHSFWSNTKRTSSSSHWKLTSSHHNITEKDINLCHASSWNSFNLSNIHLKEPTGNKLKHFHWWSLEEKSRNQI